jgi:hypothetical protein
VHAQTVGQVFTRLGLDVEHFHRTEVLDARDLQTLYGRGSAAGQIEGSLELVNLDRVDETDLIGEDPPVAGVLDAEGPAPMTIGSRVGLEADSGKDPEPVQ